MKKLLAISIVILITASGCSHGEITNEDAVVGEVLNEKVTLTVWGLHISKSEFNNDIKIPVEKKFPNLNIEYKPAPDPKSGESIGDRLKRSIQEDGGPDIVLGGSPVVIGDAPEIFEDLQLYIKENKINTNDFESIYIKEIREYGKGKLLALPYQADGFALFYNQELFDKYKLDYPKDGMTWDQVIELSKKLTFTEGSKQFKGLSIVSHTYPMWQLSLRYVNESNNKLDIKNSSWTKFFSVLREVPQIDYTIVSKDDSFIELQTTAMSAGFVQRYQNLYNASIPPFEWDIVTYPLFAESGELVPGQLRNFLGINSKSSNKKDAFKVIQFLISPTLQLQNSQKGKRSVLRDTSIHMQYGNQIAGWKGKNVSALYKYSPKYREVQSDLQLKSQSVAEPIVSAIATGNKGLDEGLDEIEQLLQQVVSAYEESSSK